MQGEREDSLALTERVRAATVCGTSPPWRDARGCSLVLHRRVRAEWKQRVLALPPPKASWLSIIRRTTSHVDDERGSDARAGSCVYGLHADYELPPIAAGCLRANPH
jgi:hypothetical protein